MDIKRRIANLVSKWGTRDPFKLCQLNRINIVFVELGSMKGYYKKYKRKKYIVVNENLDEFSKKVVLAHELGHALLHGKDIIMMKGCFTSCKDSIYEREANKFAAELLITEESGEYLKHTVVDKEILEELLELKYAK